MKKRFNITGTCYPKIHYIMDFSQKLKEILKLVEAGEYFIINRPRQYGKTTTLHFLVAHLNQTKDYVPIRLTFEDVRDVSHSSDDAFAQMFARRLARAFRRKDKAIYNLLREVDLAMLRTKYLDRFSDENQTFHSVILAGVHDIKNLKFKIRDSKEAKYNSPWNIATGSLLSCSPF